MVPQKGVGIQVLLRLLAFCLDLTPVVPRFSVPSDCFNVTIECVFYLGLGSSH